MDGHCLTNEQILAFSTALFPAERSQATVEKYLRSVRAFSLFLDGQPITKDSPDTKPGTGGGEFQENVSTFYQGGNPMKKFLSLVLALVMTMSLVTVSAGAKDFTDSTKIQYTEAVDVMSAVKVIDGYGELRIMSHWAMHIDLNFRLQ